MPKWAYVDQGVQGLNIYQAGKMQGNQQMMQQGLDLVSKSADALRGITGVQQARQQMELARAAEARTQQLQPLAVRQQTAAARMAETQATRQQAELQRDQDILAEAKKILQRDPKLIETLVEARELRTRGLLAEEEAAEITERGRQAYIPAKVGAAVAGEKATAAEAVTRERKAEAARPYIEAEAAAAGAKAEYEKLSAQADLRNLPLDEIYRLARIESDTAKVNLEKETSINDLDYVISDKQRAIEVVQQEIEGAKARNDLYRAQGLNLLRKEMGNDMDTHKELRALMSDIQSAYMAIARLDAGEDVMDILAKVGSTSGIKFSMGGTPAGQQNRDVIRQYLLAHIEVLKSLINRHGYEYDVKSRPPVMRPLGARAKLPEPGYTVEERAGDLESRYAEGMQRAGEKAGTATPPGVSSEDVKNILDTFWPQQ